MKRLTRSEYADTKWGKKLRDISSWYDKALHLISSSPSFEIIYEEEFKEDDGAYVLVPSSAPDFWLESFDTRKEAEQFCKDMHLPVTWWAKDNRNK